MSAASSVGYRAMEDELPIATRRDQDIAETALQKVAQFLLKEHCPQEVDKAEDGEHFLLDRREPNVEQFALAFRHLVSREEMSQMTPADINYFLNNK